MVSMEEACNTAAVRCLQIEAEAIRGLVPRIDSTFEKAVEMMASCRGKVIVTGVGKSGHVASKIAATLASTGTPSFFLHPLDAYHGDLGMIGDGDVVIAISYSGQTEELLRFVPCLEERNVPIIAMTGSADSLLAQHAACHLLVRVEQEADPLNLVPTASTTASMAMGDALAAALMAKRNFLPADFARFHPGGDLGKRLQARVSEMMVTVDLPLVSPTTPMGEAIEVVTSGKLGIAIVTENDRLCGIITDGDVRRAMTRLQERFFATPVSEVMTRAPKTIAADAKIVDAGEEMNHYSIHTLVVVDRDDKVVGVIDSFSCLPGTRFYH